MLRKRAVCAILVIAMAAVLVPFVSQPMLAAGGASAADKLHELGLFQGVGDNADGTPNFALDRIPTRNEAVTMLVRLLGKEEEALSGTWETPFTDVATWARPYVGYAYTNELTTGTGATTFSGADSITASQYITFVLRALGYSSGSDFAWDKAWEFSDELGFTNGEYSSASRVFTRGDVAAISFNALTATLKDSSGVLFETLIENGAITSDAANSVGLQSTGYILDKNGGLLLWRDTQGEAEHVIADFSDRLSGWDILGMSVAATAHGNDVVRILNGHGEPHLWTDIYYIYVANGQVVAQTIIEDSMLIGPSFSGVSADGSRVILGDGKTATVYDDRTVQVIAEYDLQALCADISDGIQIWFDNTEYAVVGYGESYLLLGGTLNLLHIVVYPGSGQVDIIYREIFTSDEQEFFEITNAEGPRRTGAANTQFDGERDGFLVFICNLRNIWGEEAEYQYRLR